MAHPSVIEVNILTTLCIFLKSLNNRMIGCTAKNANGHVYICYHLINQTINTLRWSLWCFADLETIFWSTESDRFLMMELSCSTAKKLCLIDSTLQALFDDDELLFKWTNQTCFNDTANYLHDRPDGCTEDDDIKIGYLEVKPINKANDHKKISTNLHRLGLFFKATTTKHKLKHTIQVMVVGKCYYIY